MPFFAPPQQGKQSHVFVVNIILGSVDSFAHDYIGKLKVIQPSDCLKFTMETQWTTGLGTNFKLSDLCFCFKISHKTRFLKRKLLKLTCN